MDLIDDDFGTIALLNEIEEELGVYREEINNPTDDYKLYYNMHSLFIVAKALNLNFNPNNKIKSWNTKEVFQLALKLKNKFKISFKQEEVDKFYYFLFKYNDETFELCLSKLNNCLYACFRNKSNYRYKSYLVSNEKEVFMCFGWLF